MGTFLRSKTEYELFADKFDAVADKARSATEIRSGVVTYFKASIARERRKSRGSHEDTAHCERVFEAWRALDSLFKQHDDDEFEADKALAIAWAPIEHSRRAARKADAAARDAEQTGLHGAAARASRGIPLVEEALATTSADIGFSLEKARKEWLRLGNESALDDAEKFVRFKGFLAEAARLDGAYADFPPPHALMTRLDKEVVSV